MPQTPHEPVPAAEFSRNFGRYKDEAIARRVVEVSSNGRPIGAFLSQAEYEDYLALKKRATKVYKIDDIPDELIEQIGKARYGVIAR